MDHAARARVLFDRGYTTPAIDYALLALRDAEADAARDMRTIAGAALEKKNMPLAALKYLDAVLADSPDHAPALAARGAAYDRMGRRDEAKADLQRAVAQNPKDADSLQLLAAVAHDLGDQATRDEAISKLARVREPAGWLWQIRGKQRLDAGDREGGESDLRAGVKAGDPMSAFFLSEAGFALEAGVELAAFALDREKRQLWGDAIRGYRAAIEKGFEKDDRDVRVRRMFGFLLLNQGNNDEALDVARAITEAHPDRADAWLARGDLDGEIASYEKAYELDPDEASIAWARALLGAGRKDEALEVCNGRLEKDPDDLAAKTVLGEALLALERHDEAKQAWREAESLGEVRARELRVDAFGTERGNDFFDAALRFLDQGQRDEAVVHFEDAIDLFREETKVPGDEAHRYLAKSLYNSAFLREMKVADEVLEPYFREAVELDPMYTDPMLALGNMCLRTDRTEEGLGWFKKAGDLDPSAGQPFYYLARHYADHGQDQDVLDPATRAFEAYSRRGQSRFAADAIMLRGQANENLGNLFDAKRDYDLAYDYGHPTGYAMGDQIRERIAVEHPDSDEAAEVLDKVVDRIYDGEFPWGQVDFFEALVQKDDKAKALYTKLKDEEELEDDERDWLINFLQGG